MRDLDDLAAELLRHGIGLGWVARGVVVKKIDEYYAKDRVAEVKTRFEYHGNSPAKVVDATLVLAGENKGSTFAVYLMDPERMGEFVTYL